ncbi:MAG TPA: prolipoprotein diacylglyceryl transferase [Polyangiaceae bacterium]|jgi:phosphatidylglycerol:prolipoprotein diacylglycerol transferase|nr:prolipoprotein diacylglyceryl transferase [Polyangiaceae bacterium]
MHGRLFTLLDTPFPSYFVLIVVGFVFAATMGALWAKRVGQNPDVIVDLGLVALLSGFGGARLLHIFADGHFMDYVHMCTDPSLVDWNITQAECLGPNYEGAWDAAKGVCHPVNVDCFAWAEFWSGGFTFFGGFIAATIASAWLFNRDKFPFWRAVDMGGMMVPIGLGFGRLGCLMAGCCFGSVSRTLPWALSFPSASPASDWQAREGLIEHHLLPSLPVHPTQIYESGAAFVIAAVGILYLHGRKRYDGQVFVFFLSAYGCARFAVEFLRSDDRGGFWIFSTSQWIGVFCVAAALIVHLVRTRRLSALPRLPLNLGATALFCLALCGLTLGCSPKKAERLPPLKDTCTSPLCKNGGAQGASGGGGAPQPASPTPGSPATTGDGGTQAETLLSGSVRVATSPDFGSLTELQDARLELTASSPAGGEQSAAYGPGDTFKLGVSGFPALLIARQVSGDAKLMTTLQWVDEEPSSDLELMIVELSVLQDVAENLGGTPTALNDKAGHLMLNFVDQAGIPVSDVEVTGLSTNGATVAYDIGATYSDAIAATAERGSVLILNAPAGALPGTAVSVEFKHVGTTGTLDTLVAKQALTIQTVVL